MSIQDNITDKAFRSKLQHYEVVPPSAVWDRVAESINQPKRKNRAIWVWWSATAASVVLAFMAGWYLSSGDLGFDDSLNAEMEMLKRQNQKQLVVNSVAEVNLNIKQSMPNIYELSSILFTDKDLITKSDELSYRETLVLERLNTLQPILVADADYSLIWSEVDFSLSPGDKAIIEANLLAMSNQERVEGAEKWSVGVQGSPVYSFEPSGANYEANSLMLRNDVSTNYQLSMVGGMSVSYKAGSRLRISSGVNYNEVAQGTGNVGVSYAGQNWLSSRKNHIYDYAPMPDVEVYSSADQQNAMLNTPTGLANVSVPQGVELNQISNTYNYGTEAIENFDFRQLAGYVEIPLKVQYQLTDKQIGLYLLGGLNTNLLVNNNVQLYNNREVIATGVTEGLRDVVLSSSVGFGMNYMFANRFVFSLEPTMKIYLNTLNQLPLYSARPYTLGVFSGITYQF